MLKVSRVFKLIVLAILILEEIAYVYGAVGFYRLCHHASNWDALSSADKNTCLLNSIPSIQLALGVLGLIYLVLKIQPLFLLPVWIGLIFYGMNSFLGTAHAVMEWSRAFTGDMIAMGAAR